MNGNASPPVLKLHWNHQCTTKDRESKQKACILYQEEEKELIKNGWTLVLLFYRLIATIPLFW
jgi:hypothetical protein